MKEKKLFLIQIGPKLFRIKNKTICGRKSAMSSLDPIIIRFTNSTAGLVFPMVIW